jgi:glycosyltransferase involved in cell wall biosynthesis
LPKKSPTSRDRDASVAARPVAPIEPRAARTDERHDAAGRPVRSAATLLLMSIRRVVVCEAQVPFVRGGAEYLVRSLVDALRGHGVDAELVSVPFKWYPKRELLGQAAAWRLLDLSESNGQPIDLAIATKYPTYFVRHPNKVAWVMHQYRSAYELCGTRFSEFTHEEGDVGLRETLIRLDREALAECRRAYTISRNTSLRLRKYNGMDCPPLYPPPPFASRLAPGPYGDYILSVGRLETVKRPDLQVRAMLQIDPGLKLLVAGTGSAQEATQALAESLGLADRIRFLGAVAEDDLIRLYREALMVLYTPFDEDYGYVTLEAFLSGKPVVTVTDAGGPLEFVEVRGGRRQRTRVRSGARSNRRSREPACGQPPARVGPRSRRAGTRPYDHVGPSDRRVGVMTSTKLIIQIPCLNEGATLPGTLADLPRSIPGIDLVEVLVVDDGSTDDTVQVARAHGVDHIVSLGNRRGLAAAFAAGIDACIRLGADFIVNTDGDNQYCGADVAALVGPLVRGEAQICIGDRNVQALAYMSTGRKILQRIGSWVVRQVSNTRVPDTTSGFRAYTREAALRMTVVSEFSYTLESIIQAGRRKMPIAHVPVRTNYRTRPSRLFKSVWEYLKQSGGTIVRIYTMYEPLKVFTTIGSVAVLSGGVLSVRFLYYFFHDGGGGHVQSLLLAAVLLIVGFQVMLMGLLADVISANRKLLEDLLYRARLADADAARRARERADVSVRITHDH